MAKLTTAYIGLGSNLGDREDYITRAVEMLSKSKDIEVARVSELLETAPLGQSDRPKYLNAVAEIKTQLPAEHLHAKLIDVENSLGRTREQKWSPRIIDLDLLLFGSEVINLPCLTIPHPQMHLRSFVLKGLCQLNGALVHPVIKEPVDKLAARLNGADFVPDPNLPQLVSIAGIIGVGKTTLTKKLAALFSCKKLLEAYDTNPFLPEVYAGRKELALDSQLYFLTSRVKQLNPDVLGSGQMTVSDYVFDKELIYARRLLDKKQLAVYEQVYQPLAAKVAQPVLVIYLQDSVQNCLQRIHKRNRPYEQRIETEFLGTLSSDYDRLFTDWKSSPVIRISISEFDPVCGSDLQHLANQIRSYVATQINTL